MLTMTLQSILLLVAVFGAFAGLGWLFAGKRRKAVARVSAFDQTAEEAIVEAEPVVENEAEVFHYDVAKAAEQFTSGVVVPFKMPVAPEPHQGLKPAYAPPETTPRLDVAASRIITPPHRFEANLQARISSLASMTPESVEAAVQQAGSGLEPLRLDAPRGAIDDLTVISGIGPGNQQELNALGIYHYWQIAGWTPEHVAWVSNRVRFPKRIVRENWMAQAARLAKLH